MKKKTWRYAKCYFKLKCNKSPKFAHFSTRYKSQILYKIVSNYFCIDLKYLDILFIEPMVAVSFYDHILLASIGLSYPSVNFSHFSLFLETSSELP